MANIKSFPNNQDEYVGAEHVMRWLHGRTSGVFGADGNAAVAPVLDTMAITVSDGNGWLSNDNADGVVWWIDNESTNGSKLQLSVDMADAALPRIDRVVVSWQTTNYVALPEVTILKGVPATNLVAPALTNNNVLRQISLAAIRIPAGATAITADMITDERFNPSVCGIVTESIAIDTRVVNAQFEELLARIRKNLEQTVSGQIPDGSITTEKLSDDAMKAARAVNLLDNSDFTNPVNQRGATEYNGAVHSIDHWRSWSATNRIILADGYIYTEGAHFVQYVPKERLKKLEKYTFAACDMGGQLHLVSGTYPSEADVQLNGVVIGLTENEPFVGITITGNFIWAALYEGEYTIDTFPEYQPKGYMVEALNCGALTAHKTLTLSASGWSSSVPYTQTVSVEGISADDAPHISPVYSDTLATALAQKESWEMVSRAKSGTGAITFICFEDKPTTAIPVQIEVNR